MREKDLFKALREIDAEFILEAAPRDRAGKRSASAWLKWGALAACLCLLVGTVLSLPLLSRDDPGEELASLYTPMIFDANLSPEMLSGSPSATVVGFSGGGAMAAPPHFEFNVEKVVVKARAVEVYPDTYLQYVNIGGDQAFKREFRIIRMETLEVIHGQNIPKEFYYFIKPYVFVDLTVYDSLLISMKQIGTDQFVLQNKTKNQMTVLELPVFGDHQNSPELGNMIAFTDGVFDESLWQTRSWLSGYHFARMELDNPEGDLVVYRGDTEADAIAEIRKRIEEYRDFWGDGYIAPPFITGKFESEEARAALEQVKPFENGVFVQEFRYYSEYNGSGRLFFTRYINGCETEETVSINLITEEVIYSEVRYTEEDLSTMENIAFQIDRMAEVYKQQKPQPPHMEVGDKELLSLSLTGWYAKANDGKVYGIVKTAWRYKEKEDWHTQYCDETFIIYDAVNQTARYISREDLVALVGNRNVSTEEYGEPIVLPWA